MIFSVFRMVVDEFWPALLYRCLNMRSSLMVLKPGLWVCHCKTVIPLFFFSHSVVHLLLFLGSLSCCMSQFGPSFSFHTDGLTFYSKKPWHAEEFVVDSLTARCITSSALLHCVDSWYEIFVLCYFCFSKVAVSYGQTSPLWLCLSKDASLWTNCGVTLVVEKRLLLANPSK